MLWFSPGRRPQHFRQRKQVIPWGFWNEFRNPKLCIRDSAWLESGQDTRCSQPELSSSINEVLLMSCLLHRVAVDNRSFPLQTSEPPAILQDSGLGRHCVDRIFCFLWAISPESGSAPEESSLRSWQLKISTPHIWWRARKAGMDLTEGPATTPLLAEHPCVPGPTTGPGSLPAVPGGGCP